MTEKRQRSKIQRKLRIPPSKAKINANTENIENIGIILKF